MFKKKEEPEKENVQQAQTPAEAEVPAAGEERPETAGAEDAAKTAAEPEPPKTAAEFAAEQGAAEPGPQTAAEAPKPAEPDWKDRYARLMADFDNFKKRTARDREDTYRYAEADILKDLLPTVDNLALALANAKEKESDFVKGVQLVYDAFLKALKDHGAEPFDSVGQPLDPERMEAIATLPSPEIEEGAVSNEVKRGWTLKGKLLRAAQVVVSSGKPQ